MANYDTISTLYPEEFKVQYCRKELGQILSTPNFNLFFVATVEGTCNYVKVPTPPHRNMVHEFVLLTQGLARRNVGLEKFEVKKNSVFFLPAGQITSVEYISEDAKGFYCHFDASVLIKKFINLHLINEFDFLRVISNPVIELPKKTVITLIQLFTRIVEENQKGNNEDLIQSYLLTILLEIKQHYHSGPVKNISPAHYLTDRFNELITRSFKKNHLIADYAELLNVSPNHLNKSVKSVTGKSPTQWIDELIVLEAKVLLHQGRLSISEISYEVGIEDPSYFGRMFKKYTGFTPGEFRNQVEGDSKKVISQKEFS